MNDTTVNIRVPKETLEKIKDLKRMYSPFFKEAAEKELSKLNLLEWRVIYNILNYEKERKANSCLKTFTFEEAKICECRQEKINLLKDKIAAFKMFDPKWKANIVKNKEYTWTFTECIYTQNKYPMIYNLIWDTVPEKVKKKLTKKYKEKLIKALAI